VIYIAFISSAENITNLERLQVINKKLVLDPALSEQEKSNLIKEGRVLPGTTCIYHFFTKI
jgi:hypothetical protein